MKKHYKSFLKLTSIVLLLVSFFVWFQYATRKTSLQFLDKHGTAHTLILPEKDKDNLFRFFVILFAKDSFAYTTLGSKPISWATYQDPLPFTSFEKFFDSYSTYNRTLRSGWETWKKYSHLFPESHLWLERHEKRPYSRSILIVNEDQFNLVVNNNKKDFQKVLDREVIDGFQLLTESKTQTLMNGVLKGHQALLGMVLGYGKENSWKFYENCENCAKKEAFTWVWEESEYFSEENEPDDPSMAHQYLIYYSCPSFAGISDSEESKALKASYLSTKQKVLNYYKDKDFLEATLSLLAGYRPKDE